MTQYSFYMDFEEIKKKIKLINNGLQAELTIIIPGKNALICHFFTY